MSDYAGEMILARGRGHGCGQVRPPRRDAPPGECVVECCNCMRCVGRFGLDGGRNCCLCVCLQSMAAAVAVGAGEVSISFLWFRRWQEE